LAHVGSAIVGIIAPCPGRLAAEGDSWIAWGRSGSAASSRRSGRAPRRRPLHSPRRVRPLRRDGGGASTPGSSGVSIARPLVRR